MIPAHWLGKQVVAVLARHRRRRESKSIFQESETRMDRQQAERFYVSLGMPLLPESFWKKSDLYELPPDSKRKKNTHASAWHMDLKQDVRSLMSVRSDFEWFETSHHELGHIYYYLAYTNPDVPYILREGANRSFHEGIGDFIGMAASQPAYLKEIG